MLQRFPRFRRLPDVQAAWPGDWPVVTDDHLRAYPALADDLRVWVGDLESRFRTLDHRALFLQNLFWRQHVELIVGGLLVTVIGAAQAASGGKIVWLAGFQGVLSGLLAGLTVFVRSRRAQHGYLTARLKAERIKSEFFLFLGRVGEYGQADARARLLDRVAEIESAEGMA